MHKFGRKIKRSGIKISTFLDALCNFKGKVYCDGVRCLKKDGDKHIYQFEFRDNNLYLYTNTPKGRNRWVVFLILQVDSNTSTKKRRLEVMDEVFNDGDIAKQYAKRRYVDKEHMEELKHIYSFDVELRYLKTPTEYELVDFKSEMKNL